MKLKGPARRPEAGHQEPSRLPSKSEIMTVALPWLLRVKWGGHLRKQLCRPRLLSAARSPVLSGGPNARDAAETPVTTRARAAREGTEPQTGVC